MKNILLPPHRTILEQFAYSNVVVAFDYDGTLAPIVADPMRAMMRSRTRAMLARLSARFPTAVISGRARDDVGRCVDGLGLRAVIGNHGADGDGRPADERLKARVREWRTILDERLAGLRGVIIEDKVFSLALHYRRSREKRVARRAIVAGLARLHGARVLPGKQVVNVVPDGAPHKGIALKRIRERFGCDTAIYVGDDTADEDVFMLDEPGQLLTIRVGASFDSRAMYFIPGQRQIDDLMRFLHECRPARGNSLGAS